MVTLKTQPVTLSSDLSGRTVAAMTSEVRPQVDGIIKKRLFTEGSEVTAGQVLYQIDPASYQAAYDTAKAALQNVQVSVKSAKLKAQRYAALAKENGVSQQDADDAQTSYQQALANVAEKTAALETARINLAYTQVRAPISGRIGISSVTPGALVTANQTTALATIRNLDPIYVDLTQSSAQLLALRKQQQAGNDTVANAPVQLTLEDGSVYAHEGSLQLTEVAVDEATGAVTLRAKFPNPEHQLLPGMFVRASVRNGVNNTAILAPQQGITHDAKGNATALVVNQQQQVERREVVTERTIDSYWLISRGLAAGDRLIVEGTEKVSVGDDVKPVEVSTTLPVVAEPTTPSTGEK
ncbi:efflux transporter, RND family, MFP subunit [Yersinia pestis PY-15]|uniref:Efflux transporter, RND family, MFP subunit n=1 Tax=Yersinia pseudotuberculosis serotype O:3 (strain YPIII) TaxID=502800 RepID=A0A0H3B7K0_YERPY|nr:efflux transporter, RND family, MFP subunit [Yersinia pestis PY-15]EIR61229.1 efflux transporter, RND family, MFP subunit [Yersinia pestis PY-25]EIS15146.1 efflux transporter, RND family, MFP subunit [Yersinia pestis PY-53]KGA53314.1 efflux transporter, RND family, MFP subunit [Yersinia pestis]KGA64214.1 efflux transporter, RND family, MFP subunit [Yersinia pseudotuberculosis]KNC63288.1 efflux transporter, RND family, MFP subunit [Yersinia pestis 14735]